MFSGAPAHPAGEKHGFPHRRTKQPHGRPLSSTIDPGVKDAAKRGGGHRGGSSAVGNKGPQPIVSGTEAVPVW